MIQKSTFIDHYHTKPSESSMKFLPLVRQETQWSPSPLYLFIVLYFSSLITSQVLCSPSNTEQRTSYKLTPAFKFKFDRPIKLIPIPDSSSKYLVAEQSGKIYIVDSGDSGVSKANKTLVLNMSDLVYQNHSEEGLLSFALTPSFPKDSRLFVYYSASRPRRTVLAEYSINTSSTVWTFSKQTRLLNIPQPYGNHNGGDIAFGPDHMLYLSIGDGGAGGDPKGHGQNVETLLGSIVRLDISTPKTYKIPKDNPFINTPSARPEIWAYGLRNPWRITFDAKTGQFWAADVGQNRYEEVNLIQRGGNYGWKWYEGLHTYRDRYALDHSKLSSSSRSTLIPPIIEYDHTQGSSITGGEVYYGAKIPHLKGIYIYGDFVSGRIWALLNEDSKPSQLLKTDLNIASFGHDHQGELLLLCFDGYIYRLSV